MIEDITKRKFTEDEIQAVKTALRIVKEDMEQWRKATMVTEKQMKRKVNVFRNGQVVR